MHQEIDWPLLFAGLALASFALCQMAGGRVAVILERAAIAAFFLITAGLFVILAVIAALI
jgi:hypothetical protein